jgi:ribosomal protein S6
MENINTQGESTTIYEVSYLLLPSLAFEQVPTKVAALKEILTSAGGEMISDENPVLIDLAYPMTKVVGTTRHKVTSGYFGWIKFELPKGVGGIEAVKKALDGSDEIIRYLIVKTVRENTLLHGKMKLKIEEKTTARGVDEENIVPDEEVLEKDPTLDMDKAIDDLVSA